MVLLPRESLEHLRETVQTPGTPLSRLDAEMNEILHANGDDREKWARYQQVLFRYLELKNAERPAPDPPKNIAEDEGEPVDNTMLDSSILDTVPKKFRNKAKNLVRRLRIAGNVKWDTRGDVAIDGAPIPGANIIDLVNAAMRDRKKSLPIGHRQFAVALERASIPREFIGSKRLKEVLNESRQHSSPIVVQDDSDTVLDTTFATPVKSSPVEASSWAKYRNQLSRK